MVYDTPKGHQKRPKNGLRNALHNCSMFMMLKADKERGKKERQRTKRRIAPTPFFLANSRNGGCCSVYLTKYCTILEPQDSLIDKSFAFQKRILRLLNGKMFCRGSQPVQVIRAMECRQQRRVGDLLLQKGTCQLG